MDIFSKDKKLRAALEDEAVCKRHFGVDMANKLKIRFAELRAADSLATFWPPKTGPERCHELTANRKGTFSVDLNQSYRLLFKPIEDDPPQDRRDEQKRWASITKIELIGVKDTHG